MQKRLFFLLICALLLSAGLAGAGAAARRWHTAAAAATFTNPLLTEGPDPWVTRYEGYYYYTNTLGNRIGLWKTRNLSEVGRAPEHTVWTPPKAGPNSYEIWAPELHRLDGKWYLYYTATDAQHFGDDTRYVFVLENTAPDPTTGTWTDKGRVNTRYSGLDGSVFEHQGQRYFLYSAYVGPQSVLAIAPLTNPWTIDQTRETIIARPTQQWEKGGGRQILEGPEFLAGKRGQVCIVYSGSACWDDNYALGMLSAASGHDLLRAESWIKAAGPVFQKSVKNGVYGPGHNCFTTSPDGSENWLVYHAKDAATGKCAQRSSRMQPFGWNPDGTPAFGEPVALATPLPRPGGEQ